MVIQTTVFLGVKGWRVVTLIIVPPSGGVRFELNKDGKADNPVMYDNHKWDDQVAYQVDTSGKPIMVEVEDRLKKHKRLDITSALGTTEGF